MMATPVSSISITFSFLFSVFLVSLSLLCSAKYGGALGGGEASQAQSHHHTLHITSLSPSSVCSSSTKENSKKGSLKVVHKHGPCARHPDDFAPPTAAQILTLDQSRVNSIQYRLSFNSTRNTLRGSKVTLPAVSGSSLGTGNYIVTVGIGTPKRSLSLVFDTGSDLTWTQCQPCAVSCYQQQDSIFDPSKSRTYKNVSCNTASCSQLTSATGNSPRCSATTCVYGIGYGDGSFSVGFFATDKLTLTPSDVFSNFFFGCGQNNQGLFSGFDGLLGLGRDPLSFVSQTASKYGKYFSYCLPTPSSSSGYLKFGKHGGSTGSLQFTPLLTSSQGATFYSLGVTAIKVAGNTLSISPSVFSTAGTIIDSGTVITRLPPAAYTALRKAFRRQMTRYPLTNAMSILDTCYDLSKYSTVRIPTIDFVFRGNVDVPIDSSGILYAGSPSQVCLAFAGNSNANSVGIFGNVQQQTLQVVYDATGGKLGFGTRGCS